jgi:hypothetical protein
MSKIKIAGYVAWGLGLLLLGFHGLSEFSGLGGVDWMNLALVDIAEKNYLNWINDIQWVSVQQALNYVVNMQLYLLLFCFGILCFLINVFRKFVK